MDEGLDLVAIEEVSGGGGRRHATSCRRGPEAWVEANIGSTNVCGTNIYAVGQTNNPVPSPWWTSRTAPAPLRRLPSWLVSQAALLAQRTVNDRLGPIGGQRREFSLLTALDESGPDSQAALSRRCGVDRSDMVALVNDLARGGLVERRPDETDRRRNVVSLTAAGRKRLQALREAIAAAQDELLAPCHRRSVTDWSPC